MTSAIDILRKPVGELTIADLEQLCDKQAEESATLEFKQDLQTPKDARGWRKSLAEGQSPVLHRNETRELAREAVAFANSYGGRIVIGIVESDDHPKRALKLGDPLPALAELVERLRDSFAGLISPPIQGLRVIPIASGTGGDGLLVIDVPRSLMAPHGVGAPPECYWRRDATCRPMEMIDLQNAFWEARTSRERIAGELGEARERFRVYCDDQPGLKFRFTAVADRPLSLPNLASDLRNGRVAPHSQSAPGAGAANYPLWSLQDWRPAAVGAERDYEIGNDLRGRRSDRWMVDQTGVVEVVGAHEVGAEASSQSTFVHPFWFVATAAHLLFLANYVNRYAGDAAPRWVIEGEFSSSYPKDYVQSSDRFHQQHVVSFERPTRFRAIAFDLADNPAEAFRLIEDRIWSSFGLECPEETRHGFEPPAFR